MGCGGQCLGNRLGPYCFGLRDQHAVDSCEKSLPKEDIMVVSANYDILLDFALMADPVAAISFCETKERGVQLQSRSIHYCRILLYLEKE
jgi:hypothetical protein